MILSSATKKPRIHESAYVAPSAVVSGDVTIDAECAILHGAVITAEGAPLEIGASTVIMENAVLKSSGGEALRFPLKIGKGCLIGPHAYIVGAEIGDGCFIATGAKIFNGAVLGGDSSVSLAGIVHVKARLPNGSRVPIEHIALGDPATIYPPERASDVQDKLHFSRDVFNLEDGGVAGTKIAETYAKFLRKIHAQDTSLDEPKRAPKPPSAPEPPPKPIPEVEGVDSAMMVELQEMEHRRQEALRKQREHQ